MKLTESREKQGGAILAGNNKANMPKLLSMATIEEQETEWLIPEIIPAKNITLLAGDGGAGKTSTWCNLAAAVSSGNKCFFDQRPQDFVENKPEKVLFFSSEDSIACTLRRKLRLAGADLENIFSVDLSDKSFSEVKFGSQLLENLIASVKPKLIIFDPLQSFIPPNVQMSQRNCMRNCLNPLIGICQRYDCVILIILHTNKKTGVYGRNRVADSADIWDIARSVLIAGQTQDNKHYLSHEKNNYGQLAATTMFHIDDGQPVFDAFSGLRDKDFVQEQAAYVRQAPQRQDAENFIIDFLGRGKRQTRELDEAAQAAGISQKTLERAKSNLRKEKQIAFSSSGYGKDKTYFTFLLSGGS